MNDFLSHLVAKSVGATDVILPRPASLFETAVPGTAVSGTAVTTADAATLEEETILEPSPAKPRRRASARPSSTITPSLSPAEDTAHSMAMPPAGQEAASFTSPPLPDWVNQLRQKVAALSETAVHPMTTPSAVFASPAPERPPLQPGTARPPHRPASPETEATPPPPAPATAPFIMERVITETRLVERAEPSQTRPPQAEQPAIVPAVTTVPTPSSEPLPDREQPAAVQKIIVTQTRPFTPPQTPAPLPPPTPAAAAASPAPAIHVTIGRVEVRATPPAAKERPHRSQSPVMSLDDYLRQRAKGEAT